MERRVRPAKDGRGGTGLIGRELDLEELAALLSAVQEDPARPSIVSIVGAPGVGKSALLRHALGAVARDGDSTWAVVDRHDVDDESQLANHVMGVQSDRVSRGLSGPVVVTVRAPLGLPEEHVMPVGPLGLPPEGSDDLNASSAHLFMTRAAQAGADVADLDPRSVVNLCRQLDGVPLSLEIAAARTPALSVETILGRDPNPLGAPRAPGRRGRRRRDVAEMVGWTLGQLSAAERTDFLTAMDPVHDPEPGETLERFESTGLVDASGSTKDTVRGLFGLPASPFERGGASAFGASAFGASASGASASRARGSGESPQARRAAPPARSHAANEQVRALIVRVAELEAERRAQVDRVPTQPVDGERLRRQVDVAVDELSTALGLRAGQAR